MSARSESTTLNPEMIAPRRSLNRIAATLVSTAIALGLSSGETSARGTYNNNEKQGRIARLAQKACKGGVKLGLKGPLLTSEISTPYSVSVTDCGPNLHNLKVKEVGPQKQTTSWKIGQMHHGQTVSKPFNANFPSTPFSDSEPITLEAVSASGKVLNKKATSVTYESPTPPPNSSLPPEGIYLVSGQTDNVLLNVPYTYGIEVVTNRSYKDVLVSVFNGTTNAQVRHETVGIIANEPFVDNFSLSFQNTCLMPHAIGVTAIDYETPDRLYLNGSFAVQPAPGPSNCQIVSNPNNNPSD